ncbi:MAG TPA: phage tail protein [Flavobacteriales bacterium]|nr:phage tail protein [Flavobacteriales bacterium]
MANLTLSATWDAGVYRIETTDAVIGGENGISNKGIKNLGNRTEYLKAHVDTAEAEIDTLQSEMIDRTTRVAAIEAAKFHSHGMNYSRGIVTYNSGSPVAIGNTDYGKLVIIDPPALSTTVRLPALSNFVDNAIVDVLIHSTNSAYTMAKITFTSFDGSIVGNVNDFAVGDFARFVRKSSTQWQLIALNKRDDTVNPGKVDFFAMSTPPAGWIAANGAAVSRTTYARLFAAIGVVHGVGDGTTTFNVPDARGRFIRGWDNGAGNDPGRVFGSYQADLLKDHTHNYNTKTHTMPQSGSATHCWVNDNTVATAGVNAGLGGTETRPKNIALLACIKY